MRRLISGLTPSRWARRGFSASRRLVTYLGGRVPRAFRLSRAFRFSGRRRHRPGIALLGRGFVVFALLLAVVGGIGVLDGVSRLNNAPQAGPLPRAPVEPAPVSPGAQAPSGRDALAAWSEREDPVRDLADQIASEVDIPARAVVSYINAELGMRNHQPDCSVSWVTLAGLGRIESDHGRYGGRILEEDAQSSRPIIGVPLDGGPGVRALSDTDGGELDGDPVYDRAVGPMQFIPSTWRAWGTDATGNGVADPFNLDDAAMSAARYLCADGRDLGTGEGWWSGVLAYNNSVDYGRKVFALAESYAVAGERRD